MSGTPIDPLSLVFHTAQPEADKATLIGNIRALADTHEMHAGVVNEIELILEEWLANLLNHGLVQQPHPRISVALRLEGAQALLELEDNGFAFDPTRHPDPDVNRPAEERPIGGLGVMIIKKLSTRLEYEHRGGSNVLRIWKDLRQPALTPGRG